MSRTISATTRSPSSAGCGSVHGMSFLSSDARKNERALSLLFAFDATATMSQAAAAARVTLREQLRRNVDGYMRDNSPIVKTIIAMALDASKRGERRIEIEAPHAVESLIDAQVEDWLRGEGIDVGVTRAVVQIDGRIVPKVSVVLSWESPGGIRSGGGATANIGSIMGGGTVSVGNNNVTSYGGF